MISKILSTNFPKAKITHTVSTKIKDKYKLEFDKNLTLSLDIWINGNGGVCEATFTNFNNPIPECPVSWSKSYSVNSKTFLTKEDLALLKKDIEIELAKPKLESFNTVSELLKHAQGATKPLTLFERLKIKLGF